MTEHLPLCPARRSGGDTGWTDAQDPAAPTGTSGLEEVSVAVLEVSPGGSCPPPPGVSVLTSKGGAETALTLQLRARGFSGAQQGLFCEGLRSDRPKPDLHKRWKDVWLHPQYLFCLLSHLHRRKNNYFQNLKNVSKELKFNPNLLGKQRCPDAVYREAPPRGGAQAPCRPLPTLSKWRKPLRRHWGGGGGVGGQQALLQLSDQPQPATSSQGAGAVL